MSTLLATVTKSAHHEVRERFPDLVPRYNHNFPGRNVALFGSFNPENWERIKEHREAFRELGFCALAPVGELVMPDDPSADRDFPLLNTDTAKLQYIERRLGERLSKYRAAHFLEVLFQMAMDTADFSYLVVDSREDVTDGGYMGLSAAVEMGRIIDTKPIIASSAVSPTLDERDGYRVDPFAGHMKSLYVATPQLVALEMQQGNRFVVNRGTTVLEAVVPRRAP